MIREGFNSFEEIVEGNREGIAIRGRDSPNKSCDQGRGAEGGVLRDFCRSGQGSRYCHQQRRLSLTY